MPLYCENLCLSIDDGEKGSFLQHLTIPCVRVDAVSRQSTTVVVVDVVVVVTVFLTVPTVELVSSVQVVVVVPVLPGQRQRQQYEEGKYMRTIMKLRLLLLELVLVATTYLHSREENEFYSLYMYDRPVPCPSFFTDSCHRQYHHHL